MALPIFSTTGLAAVIAAYAAGRHVNLPALAYFDFRDGAMPVWGQLKDHQIAAVLTYIRSNWDNKAGPVFPKDIAAARAKVGARTATMTAEELETIPLDYADPGATK